MHLNLHAALTVTSERRRSTPHHILPVSVNSISPSRRSSVHRLNSPKISVIAAPRTVNPPACLLLLATRTLKTMTPRRRFASTGGVTLRATSNSVSAPNRSWRNVRRPAVTGGPATSPTGWWKGSSGDSKTAEAFLRRRRPAKTQARHQKEKRILSALCR